MAEWLKAQHWNCYVGFCLRGFEPLLLEKSYVIDDRLLSLLLIVKKNKEDDKNLCVYEHDRQI